jgi:phage gp29-like protein
MLELIEREQFPNDVRMTLSGALTGDLRRQQLLFQAMIDTWPRLQKALGEVQRAARKAPWKVKAWAPRGAKAEAAAEEVAKTVENAMWSMRPDPVRSMKGFEGTVEEIALGYFLGHQVMEVHWAMADGGWQPASAKVIPPRYYGYPYDAADDADRLMLDKSGGASMTAFEDFPAHRFLVAVNGGHSGHPTIAAPLRALTGYWLAAVYGLKWLMSFAEKCGMPLRWATYGSEPDKKAVSAMLRDMGNAAWGAFPTGTDVKFVETSKSARDIPQKVLIDLADEQCDIFILGQTLTSSAGDKGSQALGKVHEGVRKDVIEGVCDFVGEVLSYQLAPSIVALNYGAERTDIPGIWAEWPDTVDEKALAERDDALGVTTGAMPVAEAWFYERHNIPVPTANDKLFQPVANGATGKPSPGVLDLPHETKLPVGIEGADASGKALTVDQLSAAVLEGVTGVTAQWLSPVRPVFERLAALAMSKHVTDEDFMSALEKCQRELPEIFDLLDTQALQDAFENAIGSAALAGSVSRYE